MALEDDMAVLARVTLFSNLNDEQLRLLAFGAEPHTLAQARLLCGAGEPADGGFVLIAGRLAQLKSDSEIIERSFSQAGTLVGELSLVTACQWQSTIAAETSCRLFRLPRQLFLRILSEYPKTASDIRDRITADLLTKVRLMEVVAKKLS